jgi:hypothetical protein
LIPSLKVDDMNCNYPCKGDIKQVCGGNGEGDGEGGAYISLFADSTTWDGNYTRPDSPGNNPGNPGNGGGNGGNPTPVTNPGVNGYKSIGCYTEATNGRALPNEAKPAKKTVALCVQACAANNYKYAGLEYAGEVCLRLVQKSVVLD